MREATKREVGTERAKEHAYEKLYDKLENEAGQKELYRLAKQREWARKDVQLVKVVKDENGGTTVERRRCGVKVEELL